MSYLARLHRQISGNRVPTELTELTKGASVGSVGAQGRPFAEIDIAERVAIASAPERWLERLRSADLPGLPPQRWTFAADALESLMQSGAIDKALGLGWDARELVGMQRHAPHDAPSRAGLIWSMWPGDSVTDVRRAGAIIAYGTVRHIWRRVPVPIDGSICLPWELGK
jgi:hypothetical protein